MPSYLTPNENSLNCIPSESCTRSFCLYAVRDENHSSLKSESSFPSTPVMSSAYPVMISISSMPGPWETYFPRHPDMFIRTPPDMSHCMSGQDAVPS